MSSNIDKGGDDGDAGTFTLVHILAAFIVSAVIGAFMMRSWTYTFYPINGSKNEKNHGISISYKYAILKIVLKIKNIWKYL